MKKLLIGLMGGILFLFIWTGICLAQEPTGSVYTITVSLSWDVYTSTITSPITPTINQLILEVRQDGNVYDWKSVSITSCVPLTDAPGAGQCGWSVDIPLRVPYGESEIWYRGAWFYGTEVWYINPDIQTYQDADRFWYQTTLRRNIIFYFPIIYKNYPMRGAR